MLRPLMIVPDDKLHVFSVRSSMYHFEGYSSVISSALLSKNFVVLVILSKLMSVLGYREYVLYILYYHYLPFHFKVQWRSGRCSSW